MKCSNCGYEFEGNFCPECGTAADKPVTDESIVVQEPVQEVEVEPKQAREQIQGRSLLGFRSNTTWKKVLSVAYLIICGVLLFANLIEPRQGQITVYDFLIDKLDSIVIVLCFISPYIFLSNTKLRMALPLFKERRTNKCVAGMIIVIMCFGAIIGIVNSLHSAEYKADMENHAYVIVSSTDADCANDGEVQYHCEYCGRDDTQIVEALGHDMKEVSRTDPTEDADGKRVTRCARCDYEESEVIPRDESVSNDDRYISGDMIEVDGEILPDIVSDNLVNELMGIGFTKEEATSYREIFLKCGIDSIDGAEPTSTTATIDDLVAYRMVMDDDRTLWFTIDRRELFYIALNGVDVWDTSQGGFLINIKDIHIPESEITVITANTLRDLTESTLDEYFVNALYYDAWGYAREDNNYMVQCEVYANNRLGIKDWIFAKVWYEYDGTEYVVTAVVIDGVRYK